MIIKNTYAISGTWKPSTAEQAKQLAGSCEVSAVKLAAGGGSAVVALYNGNKAGDAIPANLQWFLDASTTDVDAQIFPNPLRFEKGVYAVCEQGWDFNPVVCIARIS